MHPKPDEPHIFLSLTTITVNSGSSSSVAAAVSGDQASDTLRTGFWITHYGSGALVYWGRTNPTTIDTAMGIIDTSSPTVLACAPDQDIYLISDTDSQSVNIVTVRAAVSG